MSLEFILCGVIIAQHAFYSWQMNKMVNKIMSRSFYDYKVAESVKKQEPDKIKINDDLGEVVTGIL